MTASRLFGVAALSFVASIASFINDVHACSGTLCRSDVFLPGIDTTLPVNATALWWSPGDTNGLDDTTVDQLTFVCTDREGAARTMAAHVDDTIQASMQSLRVDGVLKVGDHCEISAACDNAYDDQDAGVDDAVTFARFEITEQAEQPSALRWIASAAQWRYYDGEYNDSAECFAPGRYRCEGGIGVDLSTDDIAPWSDALIFEARVDEGQWTDLYAGTWPEIVRSHAVLIAPGTHTVTMRASLPDGFTLESETQTFTIADCTTPRPEVEAGDQDGGATNDGGLDGGTNEPIDASNGFNEPGHKDGFSCSVASSAPLSLSSSWWFALLLALFARRRVVVRARR